MASAQELFEQRVIEPMKINMGTSIYPYAEYLTLPAAARSNDEAAVVDMQFSRPLLSWLGFEEADIVYNRPLEGRKADKPDFLVRVLGTTAFIVEDKNTTEKLTEEWIGQLRRYTAGSAGYCLWTNGRSIVGFRFDASGQYQLLVDVRVDGTFGFQKVLVDQDANFELLKTVFGKARFAETPGLIQAIAVSEVEWRQQARPVTEISVLQSFISDSRSVLDQLVTAVRSRLNTVTLDLDQAGRDLADSKEEYRQTVLKLIADLRADVGSASHEQVQQQLLALELRLTDVDLAEVDGLKPPHLTDISTRVWDSAAHRIQALVSTIRERELNRTESRRIRNAYLVWRERYKFIEDPSVGSTEEIESRRQIAFAEQVSYVFFIRLLLARVLEDKGLMPRLVSDGGFSAWHGFLQTHATDSANEIRSESYLPLVYRRVAAFYRHFFQQPVFDWFLPDDYLVVLVLGRLNGFDFAHVTTDLLGFTYEAFIDRVARKRKGHFLTRPEVVEYMLDRAGYRGAVVIGEPLLDSSCGSGSFLVHAARRLRVALATSMVGQEPAAVSHRFIEEVSTNLVGLEVNPFSCYLAELNLFIQVLDDLVLLNQAGQWLNIERFAIYNTNSLEMPYHELQQMTGLFEAESALDEAAGIKSGTHKFSYVICNPPYVNRGIALGTKSYGDYPFYQSVATGDENFYLLFLRLAAYYTAPGGSICFICPLNLLGDKSTTGARAVFDRPEWRIVSITRFYSRTLLFEGVLQGVCIVRFDAAPGSDTDPTEIRGGVTIDEATATSITVARRRVTESYPSGTGAVKPWLVNADQETYALWDHVRSTATTSLALLLKDKIQANLGDIRTTWAKPFQTEKPGPGIIPLTKGILIDDWGSWVAETYLDPSKSLPPSTKDLVNAQRMQKYAQRILDLSSPEVAIFLKEISGLEMRRPVRGTIVERDGRAPVAAGHTVLVFRTLDAAYADLAYAVFGLLTSSTYNFLFSLFSTNAHVSLEELIRIPIPTWSVSLEQRLASETRDALVVNKYLHTHQARYGGSAAAEGRVSMTRVFESLSMRSTKLGDLVLRGQAILNGPESRRLGSLLAAQQLTIATGDAQADDAIEQVVREHGDLIYAKNGKSLVVPHPSVAGSLVGSYSAVEQDRQRNLAAVARVQDVLDNIVLDMYGITSSAWREIIVAGVPWASG